jgi:hypothetical protein
MPASRPVQPLPQAAVSLASVRRRPRRSATLFATVIAAVAFGVVSLPVAEPAFASRDSVVASHSATAKSARLAPSLVEGACRGQAWGAEDMGCLRVIGERSGQYRTVRMIGPAPALTNTPNNI